MHIYSKIKKTVKPAIPNGILYRKELSRIKEFRSNYSQVIERLKNKEKIKVAFFLIHSSVWKYDQLFRLMLADERFDPLVVICPYTAYGEETMIKDMALAEEFIRSKHYPYLVTLDFQTGEWLDVKQTIKPDIVFYTNPHRLTKEEYYIENYTDSLNCYVQYSFHISHLNEMQYNQMFHNYLYRAFYETLVHLKMASRHSLIKAANVEITGYPGVDVFLDKGYLPADPWKIKDRKIKRIIWSPHHTIDDNEKFLSYSCFLKYAEFIPAMAEKYKGLIQVAFKPHPILKAKLNALWGKDRTGLYYEKWEKGENLQLEESGYIDLFLTSDAIVNDSGSFIAEYLFVNKRSAFMYNDEKISERLNEFGKMAINCYEKIFNGNDLEKFIGNLIHETSDQKQELRNKFINDYISQTKGNSASENILTSLKTKLS